jgi:hypothetical protein
MSSVASPSVPFGGQAAARLAKKQSGSIVYQALVAPA